MSFQIQVGPVSGPDAAPEESAAPALGVSPVAFETIAFEFRTRMQVYWKYIRDMFSVAVSTSYGNILGLLIHIEELSKHHERSRAGGVDPIADVVFRMEFETEDKRRSSREKKIQIYSADHFTKIRDFQTEHDAALRILYETSIQQLVNSYEHLLGDLLRSHLLQHPECMPKDQSIPYRDLMSFGSLDEAKEWIVRQQVSEFIKRKNTDEQLKFVRDELHADLQSQCPEVGTLRELILRRHAIVHVGGVANSEYMRLVRKIPRVALSDVQEGMPFTPSPGYVHRAWNAVYSCGTILCHLLAVSIARAKKDPSVEDAANNDLSNAGFACLVNGQYQAAKVVLEYACERTVRNDSTKQRLVVNLAQTFKWLGDESKCAEVLDRHDWKAFSPVFQLAEAALRGDAVRFASILPAAVSQDGLSSEDLASWPVFKEIRLNPEYPKWFASAFPEYSQSAISEIYPKVLDFSPKETMDAYSRVLLGTEDNDSKPEEG